MKTTLSIAIGLAAGAGLFVLFLTRRPFARLHLAWLRLENAARRWQIRRLRRMTDSLRRKSIGLSA